MNKLTKDMYQAHWSSPGPFGLRNGQTHPDAVIKNAGWYNQRGEFLGYGDLNAACLMNIQCGMEESYDGEAFVILESDDWDTAPDKSCKDLGTEYVAEHCLVVITSGGRFCYKANLPGRTTPREKLIELIADACRIAA